MTDPPLFPSIWLPPLYDHLIHTVPFTHYLSHHQLCPVLLLTHINPHPITLNTSISATSTLPHCLLLSNLPQPILPIHSSTAWNRLLKFLHCGRKNFNSACGKLLNLKTGLLEDFMGQVKYYFWINQANKFNIKSLNLHPAGFSIEAAKSFLENFHSHVDNFKTKFERITAENFPFFLLIMLLSQMDCSKCVPRYPELEISWVIFAWFKLRAIFKKAKKKNQKKDCVSVGVVI